MAPVIARYLPDFSVAPAAPPPRAQDGLALLLRTAPAPVAPPAPVEDREALLRAAEAKGWEQGRADAQAESAAVLARAREDFDGRLDTARRDWCRHEAEALAAGLNGAVEALATALSERIGRLLVPVVTESLRVRAVEELSGVLAKLLTEGTNGAPIRVEGPGDLLEAIAERLGPLSATVAFTPAQAVDVTVRADQTLIETQLGAWADRLAAAVGAR
ncbi:hypothetical protein [Methylobacterium sp. Leaf466]|uniref:hypothetical protein n=1 Tax=Methylobacterium sp. Leaf466 TaxID=1736386 RepID=UPI0006F2B556|nr:hypothetical protein [Methylobacterium sp. Leaf466]KQT87570.1 hypothetical protein ASG59_15980 [Methylobacterium sp. Leaf466]